MRQKNAMRNLQLQFALTVYNVSETLSVMTSLYSFNEQDLTEIR
jgi:hypothetical protein